MTCPEDGLPEESLREACYDALAWWAVHSEDWFVDEDGSSTRRFAKQPPRVALATNILALLDGEFIPDMEDGG